MPLHTPGTVGYQTAVDTLLVETKVQTLLFNDSLGLAATATALNPSELAAGSAMFRKPSIVQSEDFVFADRDKTPDLPEQETVKADLDQRIVAKVELTAFDKRQLGSIAGAQEAFIAQGFYVGFKKTLDAEFVKLAYNQAFANGEGIDKGYIINAKYSSARLEADLTTMYFDTVDIAAKMRSIFNKQIIGLSKNNTFTIVAPAAFPRFIAGAKASAPQYENIKNGQFNMINGIALAENEMLTTNIAAADCFSKNRAYDFSKLENTTVHKEAIALPVFIDRIVKTIGGNSGSDKYIFNGGFGRGIIRPELVKAIFNVKPTGPLTFHGANPTQVIGYTGAYSNTDKKVAGILSDEPNKELMTENINLKKQLKDLAKRQQANKELKDVLTIKDSEIRALSKKGNDLNKQLENSNKKINDLQKQAVKPKAKHKPTTDKLEDAFIN